MVARKRGAGLEGLASSPTGLAWPLLVHGLPASVKKMVWKAGVTTTADWLGSACGIRIWKRDVEEVVASVLTTGVPCKSAAMAVAMPAAVVCSKAFWLVLMPMGSSANTVIRQNAAMPRAM